MTTLSIATSARIGSSRCGSPKPCPTHSQSRQSVVPRPTIPASSYELGPIRSAYGHRDRRDSRGGSGNLFGNKVSSDRSVGNSMTKIARMTPTIPRGTVIGKRTGGPPLIEVEHFHKCTKRAAVGSICAISPRCLTTRNRCRILRKIRRNSSKKQAPVSRGPIPYGARRTSGRAAIVVSYCHGGRAVKSSRGTRPSSLLFAGLFLRHFQHLRLTAICLGEIRQVRRRFSVGCRPRHSLDLFCLPAQKLSFLHHRGPSAQLRPSP